MAAAPSEARNAAVSATKAKVGARRSIVIPAKPSIIRSRPAESRRIVLLTEAIFSGESVSGTPAVHRPRTRTPRGPTSAAKERINDSVDASAGEVLPISGVPPDAEPLVNV